MIYRQLEWEARKLPNSDNERYITGIYPFKAEYTIDSEGKVLLTVGSYENLECPSESLAKVIAQSEFESWVMASYFTHKVV